MLKIVFLLLYLFIMPVYSGEFTIYGELGRYNKAYTDTRVIKGYNKSSISSQMLTTGGYYIGKFDTHDTIWGIGITQSKVEYSGIQIEDKLIEQPEMIITVPYIFAGLDKKYWGFDIGVSYYFNIEKYKTRKYINGSVSDNKGWDINRFKSHTFVNAKFRLLRKNKIHFEFLLARDEFSPVDSLLRFNIVLPVKNFIFNTDISLFMPANNFTESDVILKSNERFGLGIKYKISNFNIGVNFSILIKNAVGGDGYIKLINRFSGGLNLSLKF